MAKNYMPEVAKLLGVELDEEFKLEKHDDIYKFTEEGLMYCLMGNRGWRAAPFTLNEALSGKFSVVKLPRKPKNKDDYWFVGWLCIDNDWEIRAFKTHFSDVDSVDNLRFAVGNCFRTYEEAEAQKYEVFKRLTGKDWHETYGKEGGNNATD